MCDGVLRLLDLSQHELRVGEASDAIDRHGLPLNRVQQFFVKVLGELDQARARVVGLLQDHHLFQFFVEIDAFDMALAFLRQLQPRRLSGLA